ncbi:hypothetical protein D9M69_488620 [compost metagenome]
MGSCLRDGLKPSIHARVNGFDKSPWAASLGQVTYLAATAPLRVLFPQSTELEPCAVVIGYVFNDACQAGVTPCCSTESQVEAVLHDLHPQHVFQSHMRICVADLPGSRA